MANYRKGYRMEREVVEFFKAKGFYVIRSAGSKKPDIIAAKNGKRIVAECKYTSKNAVYIEAEEIENLRRVASHFDAVPVVLVKKKGCKLKMVGLEALERTEKGYKVRLSDA